MTPSQCTLSKTISQLLNYNEFLSAAWYTNCAIYRHKPDVTSPCILFPSSPDVIYLPEKKRNCISLKFTCSCEERREKGSREFILSRLQIWILQFHLLLKQLQTWEQIQFHSFFGFFFIIFHSHLFRKHARLLRTFTFKSRQSMQISVEGFYVNFEAVCISMKRDFW